MWLLPSLDIYIQWLYSGIFPHAPSCYLCPAVANFCSWHPSDTFRSTLPPSHHASQEHAHHFNWQIPASTLTHLRILPEAFWSVWWHKHIHQGVWCTCRQSQIPPHQFFLVPGTPSCSGKPYCSPSECISAERQKQQRQTGVESLNSCHCFGGVEHLLSLSTHIAPSPILGAHPGIAAGVWPVLETAISVLEITFHLWFFWPL